MILFLKICYKLKKDTPVLMHGMSFFHIFRQILLIEKTSAGRSVIKESTAWLLTSAMEDVVTQGTGTACQLDDDMPVAGKTGTTSSEYDLWFCGYTPYLTASIWTGYDENKSLSGDQAFHERMWSKIVSKIDKVKK